MGLRCNARELCAMDAGAVIHPLDLLTFGSADHAVMTHAFGKMLIAADAKTAAALATQHNLASVTLHGVISRPGSLQGGWHGGRPRTETASAMLDVSRVQVCYPAVAALCFPDPMLLAEHCAKQCDVCIEVRAALLGLPG